MAMAWGPTVIELTGTVALDGVVWPLLVLVQPLPEAQMRVAGVRLAVPGEAPPALEAAARAVDALVRQGWPVSAEAAGLLPDAAGLVLREAARLCAGHAEICAYALGLARQLTGANPVRGGL